MPATDYLFDRIIIVDWSAANTPKRGKDSIWIAARDARSCALWNPPTRAQAMADLRSIIVETLQQRRRALIGFDFAFGYPRGFARALTGRDDPFAIWDWIGAALTDDARNRSNRFHVAARANAALPGLGPFWFHPAGVDLPDLPLKGTLRHGHGMPEHRACDARAKGAQSVWKLGGAGSVGSQALTGIAALNPLRADYGGALAIWPFQPPTAPIVLAEVFPSLIAPAVARLQKEAEVKDAAQVRLLSQALWALQRAEGLGTAFQTPAIAKDEGWILGLGQEPGSEIALLDRL